MNKTGVDLVFFWNLPDGTASGKRALKKDDIFTYGLNVLGDIEFVATAEKGEIRKTLRIEPQQMSQTLLLDRLEKIEG